MYYLALNPQIFTSAGAINLTEAYTSVAIGGGSATALTLPDPSPADNGALLVISARTGEAHTVTNTTGFNGLGASGDVGTFGGAVGDSIICMADNGVWLVVSNINVTIA